MCHGGAVQNCELKSSGCWFQGLFGRCLIIVIMLSNNDHSSHNRHNKNDDNNN